MNAPALATVWAATLLAAAAGGWVVRGPPPADATRPVAPLAAAGGVASPPTPRVEAGPTAAPAPARQAVAAWAAQAMPAADPTEDLVCPPAHVAVDPDRLRLAIEQGDDDKRLAALYRARQDGIPLAEPLLRRVLESAASERVRVAALESWLEQRVDSVPAQRAALEATLLLHGPLVQREARERLADLHELERTDADQGSASSTR